MCVCVCVDCVCVLIVCVFVRACVRVRDETELGRPPFLSMQMSV